MQIDVLATSPDESIPFEEQWETDLDGFQPGRVSACVHVREQLRPQDMTPCFLCRSVGYLVQLAVVSSARDALLGLASHHDTLISHALL